MISYKTKTITGKLFREEMNRSDFFLSERNVISSGPVDQGRGSRLLEDSFPQWKLKFAFLVLDYLTRVFELHRLL
jgi:hypothetical protein